MSDRPLDGVTVVALEQAVAAPFATRQLADLGARVIKVERAEGDFARRYDETVLGQSSYFVWLNRSKESIVLDLKVREGSDVLHSLLAQADVFVQNLAPGATTRLGFGSADMADRYPRLVTCDISGYSASSTWAHRKAYDLLVQSEAGLVSLTGTAEQPSRAGVSIADIAGGMYAFTGILTALYRRATTGIVSSVQVSLLDALAEWMGQPAYYTRYGGAPPLRVGAEHATIAPYGPYRTADGSELFIAVQNEGEWAAFCCHVLESSDTIVDPRFATNALRVANRSDLNQLIGLRMSKLYLAEAIEILDRVGVANARLNSVEDFLQHPALDGRWTIVDSPGGPIEALLPPAVLSQTVPRMDAVPSVGEHTDRIRAELERGEPSANSTT